MIFAFRPLLILFLALGLLAGCKSDEERAEDFYQSALTYLEQDDVDRALIELRNVFDNNGFHQEARALYAGLQMQRGNTREAYGQYLRLVEQYPDTVEAREALALIALERRNWDETTRHGEAAIALDPDRPGTRAIAAALAYRTAILDRDDAAQADAVDAARAVLADDADAVAARRVVIDALLRAEDRGPALEQVDLALASAPKSLEFNMMRAQLLADLNRSGPLGEHLQAMYALYPENEEIRTALIRWYMTEQDYAGAETFLRGEAGTPAEDTDGNVAVVELLRRTQGAEAASAELDRLIAAAEEGAAADLYRALRAAARFEAGERDAAVTAMRAVLDGSEDTDQARRIRIMLARMLAATENPVGAREQVELVLQQDPTHVDALKMRAAWLITDDKPGQAIVDLRSALDQAPRDTEVLRLMAEAHLRDGSKELAQERLSVAVQVSNGAPGESVAYARFLIADNRLNQAETVLVQARNNAPGNVEVLGLLGEIYLRQQKWPQAQDVIAELRAIGSPQSEQVARVFQSGILLGQNRIDEGLEYLRAQIEAEEGGDASATIQLVRTLILTGRLDEARTYVDEQLAENPDSIAMELLSANVHALQGDLQAAEDIYRDLLTRQPDIEPAILQLQALLRATDRVAEAEAVVEEGMKVLPQSRRLRLLEAYRMEKAGNFEEAIALYEVLYEENSADVVLANNLASMLSNHREGEEDLNRAFAIARRLTGTEVPAFRDTLGWILYQRGDFDAAVEQLEPAAEALPEEASVAIHLGLAYAQLGRTEDARAELTRGLNLAGKTRIPYRELAEQTLQEL